MGIYVDNSLVYVVDGAKMDHDLSLSYGSYHTVVEEWDHCGGATYTTIDITVKGGSGGNSLQHLQASGGWKSWGEIASRLWHLQLPVPGRELVDEARDQEPLAQRRRDASSISAEASPMRMCCSAIL